MTRKQSVDLRRQTAQELLTIWCRNRADDQVYVLRRLSASPGGSLIAAIVIEGWLREDWRNAAIEICYCVARGNQ